MNDHFLDKRIKKILVIDDDLDFRLFSKQVLKKNGFDFYQAENIDQALELLNSLLPDLIILDMHFGQNQQSGLHFLKIRNNDPTLKRIPIIAVSTINNKKITEASLSLNANDFLLKPIKPPFLLQKVRKILSDFQVKSHKYKTAEMPKVDLQCDGKIIQISEVSCVIESPLKLSRGTLAKVDSSLLSELGAAQCSYKSVKSSNTTRPGFYQTELSFRGIDDSIVKNIRKYSMQNIKAKE